MFLSCSSQSFDVKFQSGEMDLFTFIDYANSIGINCVEFEDKHFLSKDDEYLGKIKNMLKEKNMKCSNLAFFCSFGYLTDHENENEVAKAFEWMQVAKKIHAENFRLFAGWVGGPDMELGLKGPACEKTPEAWTKMVEYLTKCCDEAKKLNLTCVIENHNHGGFLSSSADVRKLFRELKCDNASLLLDTGNYTDSVEGIKVTIHLATRHIHLKLRYIEDSGLDRFFDVPLILSIIKNSCFNGTLSMEYEGTQDPYDCIPKMVKFLKDSGVK